MNIVETYFPTGIVTGSAFCNREKEREFLKKRLDQNAHVVMMSPRRYGKSSLIAQFTHDQHIPFASVDLLPATSGKYVKNAIVDAVSQLLDAIMPKIKNAQQKLMRYFDNMNPVIELSAFGQKIKLRPDDKTHEESIMKLLMNLDEAAKALNQRLIFVMDEFQQIALLEESHALEASIRHAVERSKNVFYVFSGSNRTLLEEMFENKSRPLYHLCDEMKLNRIDKMHYEAFIQKAAQKNWKKNIAMESVSKILLLTECHPYYVNKLCRSLWDADFPPDGDDVEKTWLQYVDVQKSDWVSDMIARLTLNQRAVLIGLAIAPETEPSGKDFSQKLEMSSSSVQRTIMTLLKKDLIYKDQNGFYHVLNPVVKTVLASNRFI